jgi:hypothetical protein
MISVTTSGPALRVQLDAMRRDLSRAVSIAVAGAVEGAKEDMRRQVGGYVGRFGKGRMGRVQNAIRAQAYPKPPRHSLSAAGRVFARGESAERIFHAFSTGPLITARGGKALAIPLHGERDVNGQLLGPRSSFWGGRLKFIPKKERGGLTVGILATERHGGRKSALRKLRNTRNRAAISAKLDSFQVPQFVLVRAVRHPKLLSPEATMAAWAARVPGLIAQALGTLGSAGR